MTRAPLKAIALSAVLAALAGQALAQPPGPPGAGPRPPATPHPISPEVRPDGRVVFRVYAPQAKEVVATGEFTGFGGPPVVLTKDDKGVWTGVSNPVTPGAYRYSLRVDGVSMTDPGNLDTSGSRDRLQSVVFVSGPSVAMEVNNPAIPHGAVSVVYYPSKFGGGQRRMHVYTPPGYEKSTRTYPVLYLIHGGGDSDDSWWTVGRAGFILDNLIAAGKAKPMIVAMLDGNAGPNGQVMTGDPDKEPFVEDLTTAIIPFVEKTYRASPRADDRALAGLSMGGIQTLNAGFSHLDTFHSLGIFSSGFFPADEPVFEAKLAPQLKAAPGKLKVFYEGYGETDIAKPQAETDIKMFAKYGLKPVVQQTDHGHEWINWRRYLTAFAPMLFQK